MTKKIELGEPNREALARIRARHPRRKSDCGALLDEVTDATDSPDRSEDAVILGLEGYCRGLKRLERLVDDLVTTGAASEDLRVGREERNLLCQVLFAVGRMDTAASHALLARLIRESPSTIVRTFAMDGMAFEKGQFEWDLVAPLASMEAHNSEILSALYALEFRASERSRRRGNA